MKRTRLAVWALVLGIFAVAPAFSYVVVKGQRSSLDALVFTRPELRVSVTTTDAEAIQTLVPNMKALDRFRAENGTAWSFIIDERSGRLNLLDGGAIPFIPGSANDLSAESFGVSCRSAECIPVEKVEALARDFLRRYQDVFLVDPDELVLDPLGSKPVWDSIYLLRFQWAPQGVPVEGGSVFFRINNGNLIQVATKNISAAPVDALPTLSEETAWQILLGYLGESGDLKDEVLDRGTLRLIPVTPTGFDADVYDSASFGQMVGYRLTYRLAFRRDGVQGTWEALIDAHTGELLRFVDANRYGHVHGQIRPSDGLPPEEDRPFPYANTGQVAPNNYTDSAGNYTGNTATTTLTGKYAHIIDACGAISAVSNPSTGEINFGGGPADINLTDCNVPTGNAYGLGNTKPSRTLFYNTTAINLKAQIYNPTNTWLTSNFVNLNVNGSPSCNAGSSGLNIYFYRKSTGCNNLGEIPGVAMHEWAHSYDTNDGSGGQTPPLETYADWTAIIQTHNSCTGAGFLISSNCGGYGNPCTACTGVRDCDYTKHNPATPWTSVNHISSGTPSPPTSIWVCGGGSYNGPCGWEDHCESGISTQALWDFVYRDLTDTSASGPMYPNALDLPTAWMLEDRLWFTGVATLDYMYTCSGGVTNGCDGTALYTVMRALDDDGDGTANGTPHAHAIYHGMQRHLIHCTTWNDTSPQNQNQTSCPALSTPTLSAVAGNNQVTLNWTTGGVNATRYFVYKNESGCAVAFNRIAIVTAPTLTYTDSACVNGIAYYYRVQAVTANDSCVSPSSNCLTATPQPCAGSITLDKALYNCADTVGVSVLDSTPGASPWTVTAWSTTDATVKTLTLTNDPPGSAIYTASFTTTTGAAGATQVQVANGATITVRYTDKDYCGTPDTNVDKTAPVDCASPVITNVLSTNVTGSGATITWTTDESANSRVTYGTSVPPGTNQDALATYVTSHSMALSGLTQCTDYYFSVTSADPAGNSTTANNGGAYYTFSTGMNVNPTYASTDVPKTIADNSTVTSTLAVPDSKIIQDINVLVNITHTYDGDIQLRLVGPDSTSVALCTNRGGSGDNFTTTWFDDEAAIAISAGTAPFTGSFRPESPLTAFDGKNAAGTWTLQVQDTAGGDTGTLTGWSLQLLFPAAACGPSLEEASRTFTDACNGTGAGGGDGIIDPGEDITLVPTLHNNGTSGVTGVSATISTSTPGITVTDNTATYPNLAADASAPSQANHFAFSVGTSVTCGTVITFNIHMVAAERPSGWDDTFTLTVGNVVAGGAITVLSETFSGVTVPNLPTGWTRSNTGGNQWATNAAGCTNNALYYPYNTTTAANAWAYTPALSLTAGVTYTIGFNQKVYSASYAEKMSVMCGTAATPAGQTITVIAEQTWTNTACTARSATFTVPSTGTYYLGFHCTSAAYMWNLYVDDVLLTYPQTPSCTVNACTPTVVPPGETAPGDTQGTAQSWTSVTGHTWPANAQATSGYKVVLGTPAQLPNLLDGTTDSCVNWEGAGTSCTLGDTPPAGSFYWFLVIGVNAAGDGHAGYATGAVARVRNSTTGACP